MSGSFSGEATTVSTAGLCIQLIVDFFVMLCKATVFLNRSPSCKVQCIKHLTPLITSS